MEEEEEEDPKEPLIPTPFGDVPLLNYPLQGEPSGSSSATPPIWNQPLDNQLAMQHQLNVMEARNLQLDRCQRKMEYKLNQFFAHSGYHIESPPPTPTDD